MFIKIMIWRRKGMATIGETIFKCRKNLLKTGVQKSFKFEWKFLEIQVLRKSFT
jgi:hypothetical protein